MIKRAESYQQLCKESSCIFLNLTIFYNCLNTLLGIEVFSWTGTYWRKNQSCAVIQIFCLCKLNAIDRGVFRTQSNIMTLISSWAPALCKRLELLVDANKLVFEVLRHKGNQVLGNYVQVFLENSFLSILNLMLLSRLVMVIIMSVVINCFSEIAESQNFVKLFRLLESWLRFFNLTNRKLNLNSEFYKLNC